MSKKNNSGTWVISETEAEHLLNCPINFRELIDNCVSERKTRKEVSPVRQTRIKVKPKTLLTFEL